MVLATAVQKWTLAGLIGMIACFVVPAAADDGEACVRGSGDTAIEACTRLIKSGRYDKRNLALIYSSRANQWERKGDFDKAMRDHGEAIRTDPTYASGYMHRGNAYARRGDYDRAIADYTKAIRLDPIYANGFYNRGLTYSRQGDHKRAIADFTATWTATALSCGANAAGREPSSASICRRLLTTAPRPAAAWRQRFHWSLPIADSPI